MKANEIQIGDWLYYKGQFNAFPFKVESITKKKIGYHVEPNENRMYYLRLSECKPIPLTPEILEKNGFKKVLDEDGTECYRYYNRAADGYIKISLYNSCDGDWSIEIVNYEKFDDNEIVYNNNFIFLKVHQFQQALRLCGIDKTIEL